MAGPPAIGGCKKLHFGTLMPFLRGPTRLRTETSLQQLRCRWADHAIYLIKLLPYGALDGDPLRYLQIVKLG